MAVILKKLGEVIRVASQQSNSGQSIGTPLEECQESRPSRKITKGESLHVASLLSVHQINNILNTPKLLSNACGRLYPHLTLTLYAVRLSFFVERQCLFPY